MGASWNSWKWTTQSRKNQHQKGGGKTHKDKPKENTQAFPSYDGGASASSSAQPSDGVAIPAGQVMNLLQKLATQDSMIAEEVAALVPQDYADKEQMKAQQKHLNMLRKIQTRIAKKEEAFKDKDQQMSTFLTNIRKHVEAEKKRHKEDVGTSEGQGGQDSRVDGTRSYGHRLVRCLEDRHRRTSQYTGATAQASTVWFDRLAGEHLTQDPGCPTAIWCGKKSDPFTWREWTHRDGTSCQQ